jgi:hypothetical protein
MTGTITSGSTVVLVAPKRAVRRGLTSGLEEAIDAEADA